MEVLQHEYVKLNGGHQASSSKHQNEVNEYEAKMTSLNEKMMQYKEERENTLIKAGEYKAELEALEILVGHSNEAETLIERVTSWQLETGSKVRDAERARKERELEEKNLKMILTSIEKQCDIQNGSGDDDELSVAGRLGSIQEFIKSYKDEMKAVQESVLRASPPKQITEEQVQMEVAAVQGSTTDLAVFEEKIETASIDSPESAPDIVAQLIATKEPAQEVVEAQESGIELELPLEGEVDTYRHLEDQIASFATLTEQLQQQLIELQLVNQKSAVDENVRAHDNSSYLKTLLASIEEISALKGQLEKNISFSKVSI